MEKGRIIVLPCICGYDTECACLFGVFLIIFVGAGVVIVKIFPGQRTDICPGFLYFSEGKTKL